MLRTNVVYRERQVDEDSFVLEDVYSRIRLELAEADDDRLDVRPTKPVIRALLETVQALLELHGERTSCFGVCLVAGHHLDAHVFFDVGFGKCHLYVQHVRLVVQLRRDCEHHADALEPVDGSEGATAVDARDLQKSLHDESIVVGTVCLDFEHPPAANNILSHRDCGNWSQVKDAVLLQTRNLLARCCLQRAAWGKPMISLKVFGTRYDSRSLEQLGWVLPMV